MLGLGLSLPALAVRRPSGEAAFTPASLFAAGEQGVWYDPSDLSTMFQDTDGTTPVTAAGQPVGLLLDKSRGLVLGPELVTNGTFDTDTTGWILSGGTASFSGGIVTLTNVTSRATISQGFSTTPGRTYKFSFGSISNGNSGPNAARIRVVATDSYSGTILLDVNQGSSNSSLFFTATGSTTFLYLANNTTTAGNFVEFGGAISVRELPGNHATQATAAGRPILRQLAGGEYYLEFDGIDDSLVTGTITPGVDKAQVFAGVRKLSDAAVSIAAELTSVSITNGALSLFAGSVNTNRRWAWSTSMGQSFIGTADQPAPATVVISSIMDRAETTTTNIIKPRINGAPATLSEVVDANPTGNFANDVINIGARDQASLFLNGHIYSLIVRFGSNLDTPTIENVESFVANKTGVTL
jgi:hypothetical protein